MPSKQAGVSLVHAVVLDAKRCRGIKITPGDLEERAALKAEAAPLAKSA